MRIAAYCRVSTDNEKQLCSLENQKEFFTEYADKNGYTLVKIYADEGISGTSLKKRTEFLRLMSDARLGLFEMVVCKDVSRFARNTVDLLNSIRELKSMGIALSFLNSNMESQGDTELLVTIMGAVAQEESVNLSKRIKFGKKITGKKGRAPRMIFGYDHIDNYTLAINLVEAETVRLIFHLYTAEGYGCRKISLELNRRGISTKNGYSWDSKGVRRVLTNSIYCGEYVNCKFEVEDCLTGKLVSKPAEEHVHHSRPEWAIVSPDTFEKARNLLGKRREQYDSGIPFREARNSTKHLFSTLIKCENCGRSFARKHYNRAKGSERVFWKCATNDRYTAEQCENTVKLDEYILIDAIRDYFSSIIKDEDVFIRGAAEEIQRGNQKTNKGNDSEDIKRKKAKLEKSRHKYQDMYINDVISMSELKTRTSEIEKELNRLDGMLNVSKKEEKTEQEKIEEMKQITNDIKRFLSLETATNVDLRRIVDRITVNKSGEVKIYIKNLKNAPNETRFGD